jgi:ribose transport system substrate-binding protein
VTRPADEERRPGGLSLRLALLAAALAALAALALGVAYRGGPAAPRPRDKAIAVFKQGPESNAFWSAVCEGLASGAEDFGFAASVRAPRDETFVDEQIRMVRSAIAERPAAIILAAADVKLLVGPVREAKARGIKVICVDSFIESQDADARVGTDNYEAGQKCGSALRRLLPAGSTVEVMSYVQGSSTAIGRETGLRMALGEAFEVGRASYSGSDTETAYRQARGILAARKGAFGIAALNLPTLAGAARALDESGRAASVVLVGVDGSAEIVKRMERGVIRDAIVQKPFNMGYISMRVARELLSGKRQRQVYTNTGSVDINKGNMFAPENEKLLFPVSGR